MSFFKDNLDIILPIAGFGLPGLIAGTNIKEGEQRAKRARKEAAEVRRAGEAQASDRRRAAAALASTQRAQYGASGLTGGTPALASLATLLSGMEDSSRIIRQTGRQANRLRRNAKNQALANTRAQLINLAATMAQTAIGFGIGGVPGAFAMGGGSSGLGSIGR